MIRHKYESRLLKSNIHKKQFYKDVGFQEPGLIFMTIRDIFL